MGGNVAVLDAVRSVAVLLVLASHTLETIAPRLGTSFHPFDWQAGRLGVMLFFVHTALVLMASLQRMPDTGWAQARAFYLRRAFRIYPLAIATVLLVTLAGIPQHPNTDRAAISGYQLAVNLVLLQDLASVDNVLAPLWSLPLEVEMYALLPLLFWTVARHPRRALLLWTASAAAWLALGNIGTRLWEFTPCFLAGIVAFSLWDRVPRRLPFAGFAVLATLAAAGYVAYTRWMAIVHAPPAAWLLCLTIGILLPFTTEPRVRWLRTTSAEIARYSYGIYLAHVPALWIAFVAVTLPGPLALILALVLTALLSIAAYHGIEAPGIRYGHRFAAHRQPRPTPPPAAESVTAHV